MIFDSTITSMNESAINTLLENVEDRFEDNTMAEATAIVVGEQEINWTRFMQGIGLDELKTVMEGQEVVYEGARWEGIVKKAKGFFQMVLTKLAQITKSFIAKVDQVFKSNDAFVKKYEKDLNNMSVPADFKFKGYNFTNLGEGLNYNNRSAKTKVTTENFEKILKDKDEYSPESAENSIFPNTDKISGETLGEKLRNYLYGSKEKEDINILIDKQITILKETKKLKSDAKTSYTSAANEIKGFISAIDKAQKEFKKAEHDDLKKAARFNSAFNILLTYWKRVSSALSQGHGAYMSALGARNRQAKAICTKIIIANGKPVKKEPVKEGFINTETFLGGVEYI